MAFYINLDRRQDRKRDFENEFLKFDMPIPERYSAHSNFENGCLGCTLSHLNVLKLARARKMDYVILFEDDFQFVASKEEYVKILNNLPPDFDVVMLSHNVIQKGNDYNSLFGFCKEVQTASGYIVHSRFYDALIERVEEGFHLFLDCFEKGLYPIGADFFPYINDQYWKKLQPESKWYYCLKRVGIQRSSYSDNFKQFVDYKV